MSLEATKREAKMYLTIARDMVNQSARDLRALDKASAEKRNKPMLLREKLLSYNRKLNGLIVEIDSL